MLGVSPASDTNTRGLGEAKLSTVLVTSLAPGIMCLRFVQLTKTGTNIMGSNTRPNNINEILYLTLETFVKNITAGRGPMDR